MKCPACKTKSPDSDAYSTTPPCVCGYAFYGPQTDSIAVLAASMGYLRSIRKIAVVWSVVIIICTALTLLVLILNATNR